MTDTNLGAFKIEVDTDTAGQGWFTLWHDNCGQYLIEDYQERTTTDLSELNNLCDKHLETCDN